MACSTIFVRQLAVIQTTIHWTQTYQYRFRFRFQEMCHGQHIRVTKPHLRRYCISIVPHIYNLHMCRRRPTYRFPVIDPLLLSPYLRQLLVLLPLLLAVLFILQLQLVLLSLLNIRASLLRRCG